LAGSTSADAASFLPAFLSADRGLLPYLAELCATLTPEQRALALGLDRPTTSDRVAAARTLLNTARIAVASWRPGERPFWRPSPDPALLLAQVGVDNGRLELPGGRRFWDAALTVGDLDVPEDIARALWRDAEPVEPAWLIERVFSGSQALHVTRYEQVLLGARLFGGAKEDAAPEVLIAVRAHARFPELVRTLERMGVSGPELIATIVRRANALPRATDGWRARAAIVQWQSALMILLRTSARGMPGREAPAPHTSTEALHSALSELAGSGTSPRRSRDTNPATQQPSYAAILPWLATWLGRTTADANPADETLGQALINRLAASDVAVGRRITWEDTHYKIDFAAAERSRVDRVRSRGARRWLDAALAALDLARGLTDVPDDRSAPRDLRRLEAIAGALPRASSGEFGDAARGALAVARRHLAEPGRRTVNAAREALHDVADALGALALQEVAYAVSMGWAEGLPLKADAAAARHRLTIDATAGQNDDVSWTSPRITTGGGAAWHVRGGVLGLDLALAPVTLRRLSMNPPSAPPTLSDGNRHLLTTTVVLLDRRRFTDAAQREVAEAIARGRARVAGATSPEGVASLASEAGLSPLRVGLGRWSAQANLDSRHSLFSLPELIRLGLGGRPFPAILSGWGNRETTISGRHACGPLPVLFWERYAGRWSHGMLAYSVPDLQLALASQLADMQFPAVLVPDLMAIAVQDFVHSVPARHPDDWQSMSHWVAGLKRETTEQYLGRLTIDGPLRIERSPGSRP
jgi:hypothetical protein